MRRFGSGITIAVLSRLITACAVLWAGCPAAPPQAVPPVDDGFGQALALGSARETAAPQPSGGSGQPAIDGGSRLATSNLLAGGRAAVRVADGEPCYDSVECQSGACEGHGCSLEQPGVCVAAERTCRGKPTIFCDCYGESFEAPSDCPGRVYDHVGPCPPPDAGPS